MLTHSKTVLGLLLLVRPSFLTLWAVCFFRKVPNEKSSDVLWQKTSTTLATPSATLFVMSSAILLGVLRLFQLSIEILGGRTHIQSEFNAGTKMDIESPAL